MRLLQRRSKKRRIAVIGLDCAEPSLIFDHFADHLPNITGLRQQGLCGKLESVIPAITVPAWSCMMSGKDPGTLGIYGFRNRSNYSYNGLALANAEVVHEARLWDILSRYGKKSIVLGVPGTYPPTPIQGEMVSCFLTPSSNEQYTYPASLKDEIANWVGDYPFDVKGFRTENKGWLLEQLYAMTRKHFEVARCLVQSRDWDFFMMVEIGVDRMHHGFWHYFDTAHRFYESNSPFRNAILDYYIAVDREIGTLLSLFDEQTHVMFVSDHGAKKLDGGICLNEWLIREGYLVLSEAPAPTQAPILFETLSVDWSRTRAWGEGGYYGRVFLNIKGREPQGIVAPEDSNALLMEIRAKLEALGDENGNPIGTRCFQPHEIYQQVNGIPPDLLIYFGDLSWRSIGTVGWNRIHVFENDTGPDDANHAQNGIFIYHDPQRDLGGRELSNLHLMQIAPTVLQLIGVDVPADMQKPPIRELLAPR
jgi:predicted AlkP superfamily phosphohydrolase/phosphomutase